MEHNKKDNVVFDEQKSSTGIWKALAKDRSYYE